MSLLPFVEEGLARLRGHGLDRRLLVRLALEEAAPGEVHRGHVELEAGPRRGLTGGEQLLDGPGQRLPSQTGLHPGALKDMVSSPGGTTIAGITALEEGGIRATFIRAVERATLRSRELGRGPA